MIHILACGPLNTVQDLGRAGYRNIGITATGAMDPIALRVGNISSATAKTPPRLKSRPSLSASSSKRP